MTSTGLADGIWTGVNAFTGAGLGASFYVLIKTQPYLLKRSFDPRYNASYISRFITGVIGGVILATAIGPVLPKQAGSVIALTPGLLAILGGYAAEAVELVLQRLVEILLSIVRGDGSADVKAKAAAAQVQTSASVDDLLQQLQTSCNDPAKFKATSDKIRAVLRKKP